MTNEELIAKIKAEIERRISFHNKGISICTGLNTISLTHSAGLKEDEELLSFLSTLESEKPSGTTIEEPIDGVLYAAACGIKNATGKSEKPMNQEGLENEAVSYCFDNGLNISPMVATDFARHFAKWGAEHLKR